MAPALPIRPGDSGDGVRDLQQALTDLATERGDMNLDPESVSGHFDAKTEGAVKMFQVFEGLPDTGVVDDATWLVLDAKVAPLHPAHANAAPAEPDPDAPAAGSAGIEWVTEPHLADGKIAYAYRVTTNATLLVQENIAVKDATGGVLPGGQVYEVHGLAPNDEHETHAPIGTGIRDGDYTVEVGAYTDPVGYGHHVEGTVEVTIRGEVAYPRGAAPDAAPNTVRLLSFEIDGGKLTFGYSVSGGASVENVHAFLALVHNGVRRWSTTEDVANDAQDIVSLAFPAEMVEPAGWSLELFLTARAVDGTTATCHVAQALTVDAGAVKATGDRQTLDD